VDAHSSEFSGRLKFNLRINKAEKILNDFAAVFALDLKGKKKSSAVTFSLIQK
jgi:hypothetical protein